MIRLSNPRANYLLIRLWSLLNSVDINHAVNQLSYLLFMYDIHQYYTTDYEQIINGINQRSTVLLVLTNNLVVNQE